MPLSLEQETLLRWIQEQGAPVCHQQMREMDAPSYTPDRVDSLFEEGKLSRQYVYYGESMVAGYALSDMGLAALQEQQQLRDEREENRRERRRDRKAQILAAIACTVFGSLLTLFFQHLRELYAFVQSLLG